MTTPYRRSQLSWPITKRQWEDVNDEIEAIYRELKRIRGTTDDAVSEHDLLSTTHPDTTAAAEVDGDLIVGSGGKWARLPKGANGEVLQLSAGQPVWAVPPSHDLLSATHGDTTAAAVGKGAIIAGSATKWEKIAVGTDGYVLTADSSQSNGITWRSLGSTVTASVYRSSAQTLTHNVEAAISHDTEHFDASGLWAIGDPTKLVIPTGEDGVYFFHAQIKLGTGFAGVAHVRLYKNGTLVADNTYAGADLAAGNEPKQVAWLGSLVATDYVELKVLLELAAGAGTFDVSGGSSATFLQAFKATPQAASMFTAGSGISIAGSTISVTNLPALVLLEQHSASASATLDFTSAITSDYDEYLVEFVNVVPATNAVHLLMRMSTDGGATYDSGANYGWGIMQMTFGFSSTTGVGAGANSGLTEMRIGHSIANTANYSLNGTLRLFNPGGSIYKQTISDIVARVSDGNMYRDQAYGLYLSTTAVNAFRFLFSSGNITSGTIRVYGVKK